MFLKLRVKAAIAKFITANNLHAETLSFFEAGPIDVFMPLVERAGFDANQGAVAVITSTVTEGATNGALTSLKANAPHVYRDLVALWKFCGALCAEDERRFGHAVIVGTIDGNPFEYTERDSYIQSAIDGFDNEQLRAKSSGGKIGKATFRCPSCGEHQSVSIFESVRASDGDLKRKLLSREIFRNLCSECGTEIEFSHPIFYHDTDRELAIWLCNDGVTEHLEDAMDAFSAKVPKSYKLRIVHNIDELVEKTHIFDNGLSDLLVHMIKISIASQCGSDTDQIRFGGIERKKNGALSMTFDLVDQERSMTMTDINDPTPSVRLWNKLEEDLDWVYVCDRTIMPIFKMYNERFPSR